MDVGNTYHNRRNNHNQSNQPNKSESHHQRTIIHLDMDCYYAQVEEIRNPTLRKQPLGILQKNIVVTCNYNARSYGITKLMLVEQAKRLCPNLVLVNGEDLTPYRQMSQKIFDRLLKYTTFVEKLGLDEHFLDVSALVEQRRRQLSPIDTKNIKVQGCIYPTNISVDTFQMACNCECPLRLAIASYIAQEIRQDLFSNLEITCCAGVSFNKLLAKLVGNQNKPNKQTVLASSYSEQFMRELFDLHRITGIGQKTTNLLLENGITNIEELQKCDTDILRKKFGYETALKLKDLAFGRDNGTVRSTGKPKTISLEDSCKPISVRNDIEERFRLLLMRLMEQVAEDGRIPICIKVILRKFDPQKNSSHRETKQANILPSLFKVTPCTDTGGAKVILADDAHEKLLRIIMRLFERVVDLSKPFNITLIGLAFSKFQQRKMGSSSIANYLIKKTDLEVQSITSLINTDINKDGNSASDSCNSNNNGITLLTASNKINDSDSFLSSPTTFQPSDQFYRRRNVTLSPIPMLMDNGSESGATNSDFSDISENEVEPSPKKSRIGSLLFNKRRCLRSIALGVPLDIGGDIASPSKLRVYDLRLNSHESERDVPMSPNATIRVSSPSVTGTTLSANDSTKLTDTSLKQLNVQTAQSLTGNSASCISTPALPSTTAAAGNLPFNKNDCLEDFRRNALIFSKRRHSYGSSISTLPSPMDDSNSSDSTSNTQLPSSSAISICSNDIIKEPSCAELPSAQNEQCTSVVSTSAEVESRSPSILKTCPVGVDPQVFKELPLDVQNELIASWRTSLALAISNGTVPQHVNNNDGRNNSNLPLSQQKADSITCSGRNMSGNGGYSSTAISKEVKANTETNGANGAQKNTLYRYFMRDK